MIIFKKIKKILLNKILKFLGKNNKGDLKWIIK